MDKTTIASILQKVREENPLVHNITNVVVTNFTANGLLSLGASPVMAYAVEEVAEMARIAGALVLNIGTLNSDVVDSMILAGKSANDHGIPVIFDPVGAGATAFRTKMAKKILNEVNLSVIRGNAAEIANLTGEKWEIKGVDAGNIEGDIQDLAISTALKIKTVVVITGKEDIISDGARTCVVRNGHPILTKVTGAGCLLTSVIGAFTAVEKDFLKASTAALSFYGVAAELAAKTTAVKGPGSFQIEFINQLSKVSTLEIEQYASIGSGRAN